MEAVAEVTVDAKNVPALRFPEFAGEWVDKLFDEIMDITRLAGYEYSTYWEEDENKEIIALRGYNIGKGFLDLKDISYISNDLSLKLRRSRLYKGDIVYPCVGSIGNAVVIEEDDRYHIQQNLAKITCSKASSPYFIVQFLTSAYGMREVYRFNATSSQPNVLVGSLRKFKIKLPSYPEQQKIATFLSAVDDKIQQLSRKKELLEQYKRGVMQQIFSGQVRFKGDNGHDFPEWEEKRLSNVAKEVKRKAKNDINIEKLEVLTITAGTGFISQKERFSQVIAGQSLEKYTLLRDGELSYNRGASKRFQFGCIYPLKSYGQALVPNIYISFAFANQCDTDFYSQLFSTGYANRQLRKFISSSARLDGLLNINKNDFFSLRIPVPCLAEQKKVSNFLNSIDSKINFASKQLEQNQQFKRGLLQQMFV